jgi:hypothetical protein
LEEIRSYSFHRSNLSLEESGKSFLSSQKVEKKVVETGSIFFSYLVALRAFVRHFFSRGVSVVVSSFYDGRSRPVHQHFFLYSQLVAEGPKAIFALNFGAGRFLF